MTEMGRIKLFPRPPREPEDVIRGIRRALLTSEHDSLAEAMLADLADVIPVVGDVANAARVSDSLERKDERRDIRTAMQFIDAVVGVIPGIGDIADILTPTNTLYYIGSRILPPPEKFLPKIPLPPLPEPPEIPLPKVPVPPSPMSLFSRRLRR